jgi:hypothetical protein
MQGMEVGTVMDRLVKEHILGLEVLQKAAIEYVLQLQL